MKRNYNFNKKDFMLSIKDDNFGKKDYINFSR